MLSSSECCTVSSLQAVLTGVLAANTWLCYVMYMALFEEEEEFFKILPANTADHLCQS